MLTRRQSLLASAFFAGGTLPAIAQPRHPTPQKPAGRGAKKDVPAGSPADTPIGSVDTAARWAFIQDFTTGAVLLEKNADAEMPPSSMTKLMTIYLVYERLKQGKMKLEDELLVSERAWKMGGSKMYVQVGTQVRVEDLIRGVIVQSGNDACIVFAEAISGSEEQFVELMNQKAKEPWPGQFEFQEFHRLAGSRAAHELSRHRRAGATYHSRLPGILSLRRGEDVQVQQHRAGQPQPAGAEGHRRWAEDRPHRGGRLRPGWPAASAASGG